jgi:thiol-disulfide isomerase/thioredoxin
VFILACSLFIWAGYYAYTHYFKSNPKTLSETDIANASSKGKVIQIYMFHVDWCPHCKNALPEWKLFSDEYDGKQINGYAISCAEINCTDDTSPNINAFIERYNIESYPTIKAVVGDNVVEFDAKVTHRNLEKFVQSMSE